MFSPPHAAVPMLVLVRHLRAVACLLLALAAAFGAWAADGPGERGHRVTLQLKWLHQFQFAGYYAAQAKGYFRDEGLDVVLREGGAGRSAVAVLSSEDAQFAIGDSDLLVARLGGKPIVALAAIFQHSPYVLLSVADRNIRVPSDLAGKSVMMSDDQGGIQLRSMLLREGIDPALVKIVPQSWDLTDLIEGRVDAVSAYATVEPGKLRARGIVPAVMRGLDYGVDFYGDILVTTQEQATEDPARTAGFVRATRKGWEYAMRHPAEIADLIMAMDGVAARGVTRQELLAEAEAMRPFVLADVVEVGHMNAARFENIARSMAELGLVPRDHSLDGWIFDPAPAGDARALRWALAAVAAVLALVCAVLLWNVQIRRSVRLRTRQLQDEVNRRTEVQRELKVSQETLQTIFGTAAAGIVMNTPGGQFITANPAYRAILGYTDEALRDIDTRELTHPDDRPRYMELRDRMLAGETDSFIDEKRYLRAGGGVVWVHAAVSLVRAADGTPTHVVSVIEDITQRRDTEEKLRESQALLAIAGRTAQLGGWMLDVVDKRVRLSEEACRIFGMSAGTLMPLRDVGSYFIPEWRERMRAAFNRCLREGTPLDQEAEIITQDGRRVWIRLIAHATRDAAGKVVRLSGSCQDITERRYTEQSILRMNAELEERVTQRTAELEASNRELEAFSYSVSHDLRSPLNTIDGFSTLLQKMDSAALGERGSHYLSRIRAGTRQMAELIEGLLQLAKLARDPLHMSAVDLSAIAARVARECREREPERVVAVDIQDGMTAWGDSLLLYVVVQNLLGNAWKFTGQREAATIEVGCEPGGAGNGGREGERVYFVRDDGAGFDMAHANKLFGTFQRLHQPSQFQGTGIGLAIVDRIVKRHDGRVWAAAAEGKGATFYFTLGGAPGEPGRTAATAS